MGNEEGKRGGNVPHFSDFADEEQPLEGEKRKVTEVLNTEILVIGFRIGRSKHYKNKDYLTLQFENGGKKAYTLHQF